MRPRRSASARATVDLPAPAGPSMAITMPLRIELARPASRAAMRTWKIPELDVEPRQPEVLDSEAEGRAIVIELPAGEQLSEHQVHERAWLVVVSGAIEVDGAEQVSGGAGPSGRVRSQRAPRGPRHRGRPPAASPLALARARDTPASASPSLPARPGPPRSRGS